MKKALVFLLALAMLFSATFIIVSAEEPTQTNVEQGNTDCTCGGSYGNWQYPVGADCVGSRYYRECDSCDNVQTAKDITPKTISYTVPAIGANEGDVVMLSLYSVYFSASEIKSAEDIVWSSDKIAIVDGCIYPTAKGTYELTATVGSTSKKVYLIVKKETESEYELFYDDFERDASIEDSEGRYYLPTKGNATGYDDYEIVQQPSGTNAYTKDGYLILDTLASNSAQMRVILPKWIGNFGDYKIDTTFTIKKTYDDNSRWFATMARVGNSSSYFPLWQAAIRQGAMSHKSGVEISYTNNGTNWTVPCTGKYTENIDSSKYYVQTFEMVGTEASHSIGGKLMMNTKGAIKEPAVGIGYVGFHLRASEVYIDSVKIVVPIDDSIHDFSDWETVITDTCTTDGKEERSCKNCDTVEERVIVGEHKLVNHAKKDPTCTESGWRAYETCERCDYTTLSVISAYGHYYDRDVKFVAHRGYSSIAPENTLPAYRLAKEMGYTYVECDVIFTNDGVAVLNHDGTINNVSNGTGKIIDKTYEELLTYDFGSWKSAEYAGTKIATFEEFIALCAELGLHPYIELKKDGGITQARVNDLVALVERYGLIDNCTWISFEESYLKYVRNADETARLGYLSSSDLTQTVVNRVIGLRNGKNDAFLSISSSIISNNNDKVMIAAASGVALETWTIKTTGDLQRVPSYVSGITFEAIETEGVYYTTSTTDPTCGEQGYTTYTCLCGASKVDNYVPATGEHTAENGVCTECGEDVYCSDASHNLEVVAIVYPNGFDKAGVKTVRCLDCNAAKTETEALALFVCKGFSVPEGGKVGVALGFDVNRAAVSEYEAVTGESVRYGAFVVAQSKIQANEIFDANGNAASGVIYADVTDYQFGKFDVMVVGFAENQKELLFAMGAYVATTKESVTKYSYIQNAVPNENELYSFVSYNKVVNPKNKEEEAE